MIIDFYLLCLSEVLLSKEGGPNNSDSEDERSLKSTKIELRECHLRCPPVEDDGIPPKNGCGSVYVVFASIMASLGGVLFGYDIGRVWPSHCNQITAFTSHRHLRFCSYCYLVTIVKLKIRFMLPFRK